MTTDLVRAEPLRDVATTPGQLPQIQATMAEWCRDKLAEVKAEEKQLRDAYKEAKDHKWKSSTLSSAANRALARVSFYEKVLVALQAGYMLFPQMGWADVVAIRVSNPGHRFSIHLGGYRPPHAEEETEVLPIGEGEYRNPLVHWYKTGTVKVTEKRANGEPYQVDKTQWEPVSDLELPEFPLVMARAECVTATSHAMEQKFFDRIAIYPARARKDPVILGQIRDPHRKRWLNFLISWRVDKRDL